MAEQLFAPQQRDAALEAERLRAENARLREQLTARRIEAQRRLGNIGNADVTTNTLMRR